MDFRGKQVNIRKGTYAGKKGVFASRVGSNLTQGVLCKLLIDEQVVTVLKRQFAFANFEDEAAFLIFWANFISSRG